VAADERIKVIFKRIFVKDDADWFGSGEFFFIASVDGKPVGEPGRTFDAVEGQWINLPAAKWSAVVNVQSKTEVVIRFKGKDEDVFFDDDLGPEMVHRLRKPWKQQDWEYKTEYYVLKFSVELAIEGSFGHHAPNEVFACRENAGSTNCSTVSGTNIVARMEIHPVFPVPSDAPVPAGATPIFPPRPAFPAGTSPAKYNPKNAGTTVNPGDPINIIPNPPVIPILTAAEANLNTAARIEYTYYHPDSLAFTDDDSRLEWSASPTGGGAVRFLGSPRGLKVMVYGTTAGAVRLDVRFRGALFATYRAIVMPLKRIPCRFNILNGPTGPPASRPRSTPANIQDHLAIANRFLRQLGLELVLDTNTTVKDGAVATAIPGIFRISVPAGRTRNIPPGSPPIATRLNYRLGVMNFAYVHSGISAGGGTLLGRATDIPANGAGLSIQDSGTPSTSWILPTGVAPDAAAVTQTMNLFPAKLRPGHPQLFAMFVTDANGDPGNVAFQREYANTIVHEFGHNLGLRHRVGAGHDGLLHPPGENLMHGTNPGTLAQDFDIIQARAVHLSPIVPP